MNKFTRSLVVLAFSMMGLSGYADIWDGSSDTSWYSESNSEFHIKRAAQLKGLFDLVKAGNSFDGRGNYSMGVKEQLIFPEIEYDKVDRLRGMDIIFVTTSKTDEESKELLKLLGMPFKN